MRVVTAQLAGSERNADRVLVTEDAVVVLDGATAFEPSDIDPGLYAETLGQEIVNRLAKEQIASVVEAAICASANRLKVAPGRSPSSTVSILRTRAQDVDLYVLGDSPIYYGDACAANELIDARISRVARTERAAYVEQLREGLGFTDRHRTVLRSLQAEQRRHRNRPGGYWIAEADPTAGRQGLSLSVPRSRIQWAVLGTDGATNYLDRVAGTDWARLSNADEANLEATLAEIDWWERSVDPHGALMPRAKRHDDKTLAAVRL